MKLTTQVENILKFSKASRNSDTELILVYMEKYGIVLTEHQKELYRSMPSTDTITRIRRKLQEQGKYEANEAVNEVRYQKFKDIRNNITFIEDSEQVLISQGYKIAPWGS